MALNLTRVKALVSEGGKPKRESDGGGLYLEATASGSKLWKMAYRFGGRQKTLSFGAWPAVSLVDARSMREQAKKMLADGQDPGAAKRALKSGGNEKTFDVWAGEYIAFRKSNARKPVAESTVDKFEWSRAAVRRQFGGTPITDIKAPEIINALRGIEATRKLHKSAKVKAFVSQVFRYAAAHGVEVMDPGPVVNDAVLKPVVRHHAGLTDPRKVGELLRAIDEYSGDASTRYVSIGIQTAPPIGAQK
ncbi:tyrosine-type recombinase/integrase [Paracoccus limosus]|uniref:tyrosine-type recombinase/integrase n=1 Tax=Paracoccus limosus TaxID=913252 RepID=UPI0014791D47|nr:integrase arm-type DNA-binding domain-containing protein [Paracoccus limosus]